MLLQIPSLSPVLLESGGGGGREGRGSRERWVGRAALISMECLHGHLLSLLGWVDEWSFLESVFLGHFYWVSPENTGYWYGLQDLDWIAVHPQNFLEDILYLSLPMPINHRSVECQSWRRPPSLSSSSCESDHIVCLSKTPQWQIFSWSDPTSWFPQNGPSSHLLPWSVIHSDPQSVEWTSLGDKSLYMVPLSNAFQHTGPGVETDMRAGVSQSYCGQFVSPYACSFSISREKSKTTF